MREGEEGKGGVRIPEWLLPSLVAVALGSVGWMYSKVWAMSDNIITSRMMVEQHERDIVNLKADHNNIVDMSADLRVIKEKMGSLDEKVGDLLDRRHLQ